MTLLKKNIIANLTGGLIIGALTLALTPLQIDLLGIEAYGLIGFIATLQIIVIALDLGLSSTITRELAGDGSRNRIASQSLIRTAITFYWAMAFIMLVVLFVGAEHVSRTWLKVANMSSQDVSSAVKVVAIMLSLRWPVALYAGILSGVQRMEILNLIKVAVVVFRLTGGILVLLVFRDLSMFLLWISLAAFIEVCTYAYVCFRIEPHFDWRPGFSGAAIRSIWSFSLTMSMLTLLTLAITQSDRILISKILDLKDLGYYSVACTVTSALSLILASLSNALMPSYASAYEIGGKQFLVNRYQKAVRVTLYATGIVFFPLLFFGEFILKVWIGSDAASQAWIPLAFLAIGFWLGSAVSNAFNVCIACRQPELMLRVSFISAIIFLPVLYLMTVELGIIGAALATAVLNFSYLLVVIPIAHRSVLKISSSFFYLRVLAPFFLLGVVIFGLMRLVSFAIEANLVMDIALIFSGCILYLTLGVILLGEELQASIFGSKLLNKFRYKF